MTTWIIQQHDPPQTQFKFDRKAARDDLQPSLSHWTENHLFARRRIIRAFAEISPFVLIPLALSLVVVGLLWSRRVRKFAWLLSGVCALLSLSAFAPDAVGRKLVPGSYAFLDDYICLENVDLRHHKGDIAAYAWRTFIGDQRRMIAYDDGHVESVEDARARQLFEQQGIPYPEPLPPP